MNGSPRPTQPSVGRLATPLLLLLATATVPGCCDLSRYLCGPEDSEWISETFTTPERTLATLKEAFRRDDHVAIFRCFSQRFRRELGIRGTTETYLVLDELKKQTPGLHMLGYAELESMDSAADGSRRAVLAIRGRRIELRLVQQAYWQLSWLPDGEEGEARDAGGWLESPQDLRRYVLLGGDDLETQVGLHLTTSSIPGLRLDQIRAAGVAVEWKVDALALLDPPG